MGKAKKKIAKKKVVVRRKAKPALLSIDEKQRLYKPGADLDEMAQAFLAGWEQTRKVRVPDLSPARLRSSMRRADKQQAKLDRETAKAEAKLAPLRDAVLKARHETFDMVLAGNKVLGALSDRHQDVSNAFAAFTTMLKNRYARGKASGGT